jgi:hypothetical protein
MGFFKIENVFYKVWVWAIVSNNSRYLELLFKIPELIRDQSLEFSLCISRFFVYLIRRPRLDLLKFHNHSIVENLGLLSFIILLVYSEFFKNIIFIFLNNFQ